MIELVFLEYKDNMDLDLSITRYVNDNLEEIIHFALDYITDSSDVERFSPPKLFTKSPDECLLCIKDLWTFSQDTNLHRKLSPVYQFVLFQILEWYIDIGGEIEENLLPDESMLLFEMDDNLKEKITKQYGSSAVDRFSNIENYLEEFFYDWDFTPDFLANVVQIHLDESLLFYDLPSIKELENYAELMDGDTYRKYQTILKRNAEQAQQEKTHSEYDADLRKALQSIQRNSNCWNFDENRLNDILCGLLEMKYTVKDQSRQGLSLSQNNAGEVDFLIFDDQEPIAIMEALKLDCLDKSDLNDHITKLLVNYDPQGYHRAYLIMYVNQTDFGSFWSKFCSYINNYSFPYTIQEKFKEQPSRYTESKNAHMVLLRSDTPIILSFYAIHIPKKEKDNE